MERKRIGGVRASEGVKKRKSKALCKPDTLAVPVNKLTQRKTGREEEEKSGEEDGREKRKPE